MQVPINLQSPFYYTETIIRVLILIMVFIVLYFVYDKFFKKKIRKILLKPILPNLKNKYIVKLDNLARDYRMGRIDIRKSYIALSNIIRDFIYRITEVNVLTITLEEARNMNIPELSVLMEEYYSPEFQKRSQGNLLSSIEKTKEVIERWKI